jgi:hypothetical protein
VRRLRALLSFIWDFIVGDDWRIAVAVVAALGLTAVVAAAGTTAWWVLPAAVAAVLAVSVWHAAG